MPKCVLLLTININPLLHLMKRNEKEKQVDDDGEVYVKEMDHEQKRMHLQ
jgi:hypothetical protein